MSFGRLIVLGGGAYGLWWAWRNGKLQPIAARFGLDLGQGSSSSTDQGDDEGNAWQPVNLGTGDLVELNRWEAILRQNPGSLSLWAQGNLQWVAAILKTENSGLNVTARGSAGELGLFQVKPGTAAQMVAKGYTKFPATEAAMTTAAGSIYFGTAYLEHLATIRTDRDWIIKAYNGGPGFEGLGTSYIAAREAYLSRVETNWNALYGAGRTA